MMKNIAKTARCTVIVFALILMPSFLFAAHLHDEEWYTERWCPDNNGTMGEVLSDKTRPDCVTRTTAVEVEFASNWYEAVGQAFHYGKMMQLKAGIVLIVETKSDLKYWDRLVAIKKYWGLPIKLWQYTPKMAEQAGYY